MDVLYVFVDVVRGSILFTSMCEAANNANVVILSTVCPKKYLRSPKEYIMKWDLLNGTSDKIYDTVIL